MQQIKWNDYYSKTATQQSNKFLLDYLNQCENNPLSKSNKTAIDLGCGTGRDTFKLLANGWSVIAIDSQKSAVDSLLSRYEEMIEWSGNLQTIVAPFETITSLPNVHLIYANNSLPFLAPYYFQVFWRVIVDALSPGGCFCGSFFGIYDDWHTRPSSTFLSKEDISALFTAFNCEQYNEMEFDAADLYGNMKHWHTHTIIAKKI